MKVDLKLQNIEKTSSKSVMITFLMNAERDPNFIFRNVRGLSIQKTLTGDVNFLSGNFTIHDNTIHCEVSAEKFRKLANEGSTWKFVFPVQLDEDIVHLKVENNLQKDATIFLNSNRDNSVNLMQVKASDKLGVILLSKKSPFSFYMNVQEIKRETGYYKFKGMLSPSIQDSPVAIIGFYAKHEISDEIINLNDFNVQYEENTIELCLDLYENVFYEGNWSFFCTVKHGEEVFYCKLNGMESACNVNSYQFDKGKVYFYQLEVRKNQLQLISKKGFQQKVTHLKQLEVYNNKLYIEGYINCLVGVPETPSVKELIFVNRDSKVEVSFPILTNDIEDQYFLSKEISLKQESFFEEKGIWDVFISVELNNVTGREKFSLADHVDSNTNHFFLPATVHNSENIIRRLRPYITADNNLAILVRNGVLQGDVSRIDYNEDKLEIRGTLDVQDVNYELRNVYLENSEGNVLLCQNEFTENIDGSIDFKSEFDWATYNSVEMGETNFQYMVEIVVDQNLTFSFPLASNMDDIREKAKAMVYPPLTKMISGYPLRIYPYYNDGNELCVSVTSELDASCSQLEAKRNSIKLVTSIETNLSKDIQINSASLLLYDFNNDKAVELPSSRISDEGLISINLDADFIMKNNMLYEGAWDPYLILDINGFQITTKIYGKEKNLISKNATYKTNARKAYNGLYYSLFFDRKTGKLLFETRKLFADERKSQKLKSFLARFVAKTIKKFINKPIWLVGENLGEVAQDNGFAFFEYCMRNDVQETVYYVSKKDNKNKSNLEPYSSSILRYDTFKHYVMYHLTDYLIVSHGIRDVIPSLFHRRMGKNPKKVIYLQHGIIAMKRLNFNSKSYNSKIKKFVVSSSFERNLLINEMNFKPKQLMVTGLARFDSLIDKSRERKNKEIVIIPTWREWLVDSRSEFLASDFYKHYYELLHDPSLHSILEKYNLTLKFFPHIEIQKKYREDFVSSHDRVKVVNLGEENIRDLIQNSSLMITDYSSVIFDFNYLEKPIIFYQFDLNDYLRYRGSYIDLREELIGEAAYKKEEVINLIEKYAGENFRYNEDYATASRKFYNFDDRNNSRRIYKEVKKLYSGGDI
ncbi:CDP-glycerol glycerophosphotransferase family protein [Sediminibacillus sp. JSM 1682029]|uniref:CDP-glycerol glycerophosphotransferase family protein n=1 Tax=Sediminibacillus sp. JSM 1682029 TaxID=3229857 RepID=UPI003525CBAA